MKDIAKDITIKTAAIIVSLIATGSAFAGDWSGTAGDGDIANPRNWNETSETMEGKEMAWNGSAAFVSPLTCGADVTFNRIKVVRSDAVTFDLQGHVLTSTGNPSIRTEGTGTALTICNGTYKATMTTDNETTPSLRLFYSNNAVVFSGKDTAASFHYVGIGTADAGNNPGQSTRLVVKDGAVVTSSGALNIGATQGGFGHALIVDGGTYRGSDLCRLGRNSSCVSNEIQVLNGGLLEVNRFNNGGDGGAVSNRIVVSDSQFLAHGYMRLGGIDNRTDVVGNKLLISGNSSISTDGGAMTIMYDTLVRFAFPAPDACEDYLPISTKGSYQMTVGKDVELAFDGESMKALAKAGGASLTLMHGAGGLSIADRDNTIARWSAAADAAYDGSTVSFGSSKVTLTIPAAPKRGLLLLFK